MRHFGMVRMQSSPLLPVWRETRPRQPVTRRVRGTPCPRHYMLILDKRYTHALGLTTSVQNQDPLTAYLLRNEPSHMFRKAHMNYCVQSDFRSSSNLSSIQAVVSNFIERNIRLGQLPHCTGIVRFRSPSPWP